MLSMYENNIYVYNDNTVILWNTKRTEINFKLKHKLIYHALLTYLTE